MRLSGGQAAERGAEYLHGARVATWEYVARYGLATHLASGPTRIGVPEFRRGEWWRRERPSPTGRSRNWARFSPSPMPPT